MARAGPAVAGVGEQGRGLDAPPGHWMKSPSHTRKHPPSRPSQPSRTLHALRGSSRDTLPTGIVPCPAFPRAVGGLTQGCGQPGPVRKLSQQHRPGVRHHPVPSQVMVGGDLLVVGCTCEVPLLVGIFVHQQDKNPSKDRHFHASSVRVGPQLNQLLQQRG